MPVLNSLQKAGTMSSPTRQALLAWVTGCLGPGTCLPLALSLSLIISDKRPRCELAMSVTFVLYLIHCSLVLHPQAELVIQLRYFYQW